MSSEVDVPGISTRLQAEAPDRLLERMACERVQQEFLITIRKDLMCI